MHTRMDALERLGIVDRSCFFINRGFCAGFAVNRARTFRDLFRHFRGKFAESPSAVNRETRAKTTIDKKT